jgi:A/G-specific adenine glycosylase
MPSLDPLLPFEKRQLTGLKSRLLAWAKEEGRRFPWREASATTYEKITVEVLLQRTTARAVASFYREFFDKYPSWHQLAAAEPGDLEHFLKPLGLWRRRAVSLAGLARYAVSVEGHFPRHAAGHRDIPALGQYVSNAVLMFQHGQAVPLLDVNMARVIERYVRPRKLADIRFDPWLQAAAHWFARGPRAVEANWAILDFAALVCKARKPECPVCPVNKNCRYFAEAARGGRE